MKICSNCRYWLKTDAAGGQCRRHAPQVVLTGEPAQRGEKIRAVWPTTHDKGWCGDWGEQIGSGNLFHEVANG